MTTASAMLESLIARWFPMSFNMGPTSLSASGRKPSPREVDPGSLRVSNLKGSVPPFYEPFHIVALTISRDDAGP